MATTSTRRPRKRRDYENLVYFPSECVGLTEAECDSPSLASLCIWRDASDGPQRYADAHCSSQSSTVWVPKSRLDARQRLQGLLGSRGVSESPRVAAAKVTGGGGGAASTRGSTSTLLSTTTTTLSPIEEEEQEEEEEETGETHAESDQEVDEPEDIQETTVSGFSPAAPSPTPSLSPSPVESSTPSSPSQQSPPIILEPESKSVLSPTSSSSPSPSSSSSSTNTARNKLRRAMIQLLQEHNVIQPRRKGAMTVTNLPKRLQDLTKQLEEDLSEEYE